MRLKERWLGRGRWRERLRCRSEIFVFGLEGAGSSAVCIAALNRCTWSKVCFILSGLLIICCRNEKNSDCFLILKYFSKDKMLNSHINKSSIKDHRLICCRLGFTSISTAFELLKCLMDSKMILKYRLLPKFLMGLRMAEKV